jgi:hypothetical protein
VSIGTERLTATAPSPAGAVCLERLRNQGRSREGGNRSIRYARRSQSNQMERDQSALGGTKFSKPQSRVHQFNSGSHSLVLVQSGSIPKAIEFVVNAPTDVPPARSKLVETLEVVGALRGR